jgi:predicted Zn-dependent protease with MMP-like domain
MERQKFEELVIRAIKDLPSEFQQKLENVDVVVEDWPSSRQLGKLRLRYGYQLLGLYEGVPQTNRGQNYSLVLPDKITIFQKPIEERYSSDREVEVEIGEVIRHEIAHHFGIGDETLRRIESQRAKRKKR